MSRRPDLRTCLLARLRPARTDEGFSLVEVMVAMLIFAVVAVASLGFITTSMTATALGRTETVAKNLNQERLEGMRNMPFFQHANVSVVPDLLDTYYTSTSAPAASTAADGFVATTGARDTSKGDPTAGPFYRRVFAAPGPVGFTQRVTTQFMSDATTVMPVPVFVSTSTGPTGLPPSPTVSVRVTTLWTGGDGKQKRFTVESQIAEAAAKFPLVTLQGRLSMLRVAGVLPGPQELLAEAGVLNLDGSLSTTAVSSAKAQGVFASIANAVRADGATGTLAAPPSSTLNVASVGPKTLGSPEVAAFSGSAVNALAVSSDGGQPAAGTPTAPVTAVLQSNGLGSDYFRATNRPDTTTRLGLLGAAVVATDDCSGNCDAVRASGRVTSLGGASHSATAELTGAVRGTVALLPTVQSPAGLIQVTLSSFSLNCTSAVGVSPPSKVTVSFAGTVKHRTYDPISKVYGYSSPIAISSANVTDPLAGIDLATVVGVDSTPAAGVLRLSDYVESWSSLSSTAINGFTVVAGNGTAASINVPGVFTFDSKPLRSDVDSTVGVQLGAASCVAGDIR